MPGFQWQAPKVDLTRLFQGSMDCTKCPRRFSGFCAKSPYSAEAREFRREMKAGEEGSGEEPEPPEITG